jgi:prepilin-type processing-associated H-X9-DG protein
VAIIAILAALLLPALARAKENARRAQCLSNLKQIGLCFISYTDENRGFIPPNRPFFSSSPTIWDSPTGTAHGFGLIFDDVSTAQLAYCPSADGRIPTAPDGLANWGRIGLGPVNSSYHYRCASAGASVHLRENRRTPAMILDDQVTRVPAYCHGNQYVNILFFDGAVRGAPNVGYQFTHDGNLPSLPRVFLAADQVYR